MGLTLPQASWVVLSACQHGGRRRQRRGLVRVGPRLLPRRGGRAPRLAVERRRVATRVLMTEVFRRQAEPPDLLRAEALRQGMLAVMTHAQGKTAYFAHPFTWAPLMLVGEGGRGRPKRHVAMPSRGFRQRNVRPSPLLGVCRHFRHKATTRNLLSQPKEFIHGPFHPHGVVPPKSRDGSPVAPLTEAHLSIDRTGIRHASVIRLKTEDSSLSAPSKRPSL